MSTENGMPSSPTGRVPEWVKEEAAGLPPQDTGWRAPNESILPDSGPLNERERTAKAIRAKRTSVLWKVGGVAVLLVAGTLGVLAGINLAS